MNAYERNPTAPQVDAEESASVWNVLRGVARNGQGVGERTTDAAGNDYEVHGGGGMNLPEGFENMTPVRRGLEVARHELVTLHGLIVADGAAPNETFEIDTSEAVALLDNVLEQMDKRTDREVLRAQLLAFVERVSGENLDKKTPEEVQILPGIASLLTTVFHL